MTVAATDEHVAFLRGMHGPTGPETSHGGLNVGIAPPCKCGYVWPCSIARLLARLESAEALAVPEGWHIEYGEICGYGGRCRHANRWWT